MKRKKKIFFISMVIGLLFIIGYSLYDFINLPSTENYCKSGDYSVTVQTNLKSGDYYSGEIIITNKSETSINNWALYFKMYGEFIKLEDGVAIVNDYGYCLSGSSTANTTIIPVGGSVHIPFRAISKIKGVFHTHLCCSEELPTEVTEGMQYQVYGENCSIQGSVKSVSENGYTLNLTITNTAKEPIENWGLVFTTEDTIEEVRQAKQINTECQIDLLTGEEPKTLVPGESVSVEYIAGTSGNVDLPTEFSLNGIVYGMNYDGWKLCSMEGILRDTGAVSIAIMERVSRITAMLSEFNFEKAYGVEIGQILSYNIPWNGSQYQSRASVVIEERLASKSTVAICFDITGIALDKRLLSDFKLLQYEDIEPCSECPIEFYDHHDESEYTRAPDAWLYMENQIDIVPENGCTIQRIDEIAASYGAIIVENNQFGYYIELMEDVDYDTLWTISSQIDNEEGVDFALPVFLYPDDTYYGM